MSARLSPRQARMPAARRRLAGAFAALALALLALAGCGSSHGSGSSADPASAVPASAQVYLAADVRPTGSERSAALDAGRALTHQSNPYLRLLGALQTPGSPVPSFSGEVAPWLGPHAGVFLTSLAAARALLPLLEQGVLGSGAGGFPFGAHGAQGAIVLDTSDVAKARAFVEKQAARAGAQPASYHGVAYRVSSGGVAFGIVHDLAVIGSDSGFRAVIDTTAGGPALAAAAGYSKLQSAAPSNALAHLYVNPAGAEGAGAAAASSGLIGLLAGSRQANISLVPSASSIAVYLDASTAASTGSPGGLLSSAVEGTHAFAELPANSWLAIGLGHVGSTLGQDVRGLRELAALATGLSGAGGGPATSPIELRSLITGLLAPLDAIAADTAKAKRDFTSWMGAGGVFAAGQGLIELQGAIVIESTDPARSRAAVGKLAALLHSRGASIQPASIPGTDAAVGARVNGLPLVLDIANGRDGAGRTKFVLGLGEASVTTALNPPSPLYGSASATAAASALGEGLQASVLFQLPTLLSLLEGVGLTEDPGLSKVLPYLRSIGTISGGGHQLGGEVERFKLNVALR